MEKTDNIKLLLENNKDKVKTGKAFFVEQEWIDYTEQQLNFSLPYSYKWLLINYEYLEFIGYGELKTVAPPEFRDSADSDILYSYKNNIENGILEENQLALMEVDDEFYYFLIEPDMNDNEYKVYKRDYSEEEDILFADNFVGFIEKMVEMIKG